ncbi:MAG: matrixin family metalloprotease [Anaerolineales bacterium]|nr:matrixin family metalloprotease [Anaerolineales bacterium]
MNKPFFPALAFFALTFLALACANLPGNATPPNLSASPQETYRYDNLPDADGGDETLSEFRAISQWGKTTLTYSFLNGTEKMPGETERDLVRQAFALWAAQTPLTFTETASPDDADILIGWYSGAHGDGDAFDGPGDVLAHASYPNPYTDRQVFLHFDDDERWVNSETQNVDLLTVAAHEIGHNLGFDHSSDPDALMYPAYTGPHRFLGEDDIAGAQTVYGLASEPPTGPGVPNPNETPPPSGDTDTDGDGISDEGETFITGTDPNNPDSDADGLGDGIEVFYRMNPLDADMDKDGVGDGQEVVNGTNPFLPDQKAEISPELSQEVGDFLTRAIQQQILAYRNSDASQAASILAGDLLAGLENSIAALSQQGLVQISEIDYYKSYIADIRLISNTHLEVDTCETWTTETYRRSDGALVSADGPTLLPQTITIERLQSGWFITTVVFLDAPAFCQ